MTYRERVAEFWMWFKENEDKINDFIRSPNEKDSDDITKFVGEGVEKALPDAYFEFGGKNEFTFSAGGKHYLFYLLPYLTANAPSDLKHKWIFSPYKLGGLSGNFGFKMQDTVITGDNIDVLVGYDDKKNIFYLGFYNEDLSKIDENKAINMFFIILDSMIGENITELYIGPIERLTEHKDKMRPLTKLKEYIEKKLADNGREMFSNPSDSYSGYELKPIEDNKIRSDIYIGTTCFFDLINEYYADSSEINDDFKNCGAKACFLYYEYNDDNVKLALNIRNEMLDRIEEKILGEKDSGNEIGMVLGTATGTKYVYIDLLLYDEDQFLAKINSILQDYEYDVYFSEFKKNVTPMQLFYDNKNAWN